VSSGVQVVQGVQGDQGGEGDQGAGSGLGKGVVGSRVEPSVPEPSAILAFGVGMFAIYGSTRRRNSK
jgi:hypothetical protein